MKKEYHWPYEKPRKRNFTIKTTKEFREFFEKINKYRERYWERIINI